jgi:hypothetical protein
MGNVEAFHGRALRLVEANASRLRLGGAAERPRQPFKLDAAIDAVLQVFRMQQVQVKTGVGRRTSTLNSR